MAYLELEMDSAVYPKHAETVLQSIYTKLNEGTEDTFLLLFMDL